MSSGLTVAVAIASAGRREILAETIAFFDHQTRRPDQFLVCPAKPEDIDIAALAAFDGSVEILTGPQGLPHQRNVMLSHCKADIIVFFDDDFLAASDYLIEVVRLFESHPDIVVATGHVIADGAVGPGLDFSHGYQLLHDDPGAVADIIRPTFNGYGCNMAVRMAPVRQHGLRFDENLPFYAWLEDLDFSRQLVPYGRIVWADRLRGVHLGTKKAGRSPGKRLGYSQVANRIYIQRKGNMSRSQAWLGIMRNFSSNLLKSVRPEAWVDRRGRLHGNLLALYDFCLGRIDPRRIMDM